MIFDILPGAFWPGTGGTQTRSPPRTGGNTRRRTQQRMTLEVKSPKFSVKKRNTKVALRGVFRVACLLFMFFDGRLAMPTSDVMM